MSGAPEARPGSRRRLLEAAAAGAAASATAVLAACGSKSLRAQLRAAPAVARADIELLNQLLDLEHRAIAAYTASIPLLAAPASAIAKQFLIHELAHVSGLVGLVKAAHGTPRTAAATYDLGHPHTETDILRLLHAVEDAQLTGYLDAIPRLKPGPVRAAAAGYFANEAQHVSLLRSLLGEPPLPAAFVTGRE